VTRLSWERLAALAGLAFVALYVAAFALGIEVGDSDREILAYYANSGHRAKEIVAFFLIAGAALTVFTSALRSLIARSRAERCSRRSPGRAVSLPPSWCSPATQRRAAWVLTVSAALALCRSTITAAQAGAKP